MDSAEHRPGKIKIAVVLSVAVLAISMAAIFIKLAMNSADLETSGQNKVGFSVFLAASRMTLAALLMIPFWIRARAKNKAEKPPLDSKTIYLALTAGLFLGLHFALWISSLAYTSVAASVTLVTTNPLWVLFFGWILFGERPSRRSITGVIIAICGGIYIGLGAGEGSGGSDPLLGDALAITGSMAMSIYLLLGQRVQKRGLDTASYSLLVYSVAAVVLLPLPILFGVSYVGHSPDVYFWVVCLALVSQMVGHTGLNWSVRWVPPTTVALAILFEPIGSSVFDFSVFGAVPHVSVWLGGAVIVTGVSFVIRGRDS